MKLLWFAGVALFSSAGLAQTFQRLGGCPELGCVFPPDQYDRPSFLRYSLHSLAEISEFVELDDISCFDN